MTFSITKKIAVAVGILAFCSGKFDAFGSAANDDLDDKPGRTIIIANTEVSKDVMSVIFKETSKVINPRYLTSVCKDWHSVMREDNLPNGELHYSTMNPFMQKCMQTFWESQFYNGTLRYTPTDGSQAVSSRFLDLEDGTFDLVAYEDTANILVFTTSMDRFFTVTEENEDKVVTLIVPYHWVEQAIKTVPDHPFATIFADWDADKAPVGMFWRCSSDEDLTEFDYLTTASMTIISSRNLYDHPVEERAGGGAHAMWARWREFHVCFCVPKPGLLTLTQDK